MMHISKDIHLQSGCFVSNCSSQGKVANLVYFCVRESDHTLDGHKEKCLVGFFFINGKARMEVLSVLSTSSGRMERWTVHCSSESSW